MHLGSSKDISIHRLAQSVERTETDNLIDINKSSLTLKRRSFTATLLQDH